MGHALHAVQVVRQHLQDVVAVSHCGWLAAFGKHAYTAAAAFPVDREVRVDVYVPGCPPDADTILYVFQEILQGRIPKVPSDKMRYD